MGDESFSSFVSDVAVHVRMLIVVPLLLAAETIVLPRLSAIADEFMISGMVRGRDVRRFEAAGASTVALRDAWLAEVAIVTLAFVAAAALGNFVPFLSYPKWQIVHAAGWFAHSWAGWWHLCVSVPLLLILLFGWFWRVFLWARFLALTAALDLRLIPSHPDRMCGLKFVEHSIQAFCILGFVFGATAAAMAANQVLRQGAALPDFYVVALSVAVFAIVLFCAPLLAYAGKLLQRRRHGIQAYGSLASSLGERFEAKWLSRKLAPHAAPLEAPDFSATTDLYSIVANVHGMRIVPISTLSVGLLAAATLIPFVPVLLMTISLEQLLQKLGGFLF